jgi:hypothetical protein
MPHPIPLPLDKAQFEGTYKSFCLKRPVKMDPRAASIDNRPVDLHRLHVEVMKEGGQTNVSCRCVGKRFEPFLNVSP